MEEDADSVLFVYRKRSGGGKRANDSLFIVGKMRDGATDQAFPITLDTTRVRFFETAAMSKPSVAMRKADIVLTQQEVF